jgi:glycosyltransferase involved in cell wall biosynthesis
MNKKITALILTSNEELHIRRCIKSLIDVVDQIVVVDSGSSDQTVEICKELGAEVYFNKWINYSNQFNWGLENTSIVGEWVLRIDADEIIDAELSSSILSAVKVSEKSGIVAYQVKRIINFMGRDIRWGGAGDLYMTRLFRRGCGRCESRWMDEHIYVLGGDVAKLNGILIDRNLNNIGWWIQKHNWYSTREAIDLLNIKHKFSYDLKGWGNIGSQANYKRWIKSNLYRYIPLPLRSFLFFLWRYFVLLGFLDGKEGFAFHFLQGFWYRYLVDLKFSEIERIAKKNGTSVALVINKEYGFNVE